MSIVSYELCRDWIATIQVIRLTTYLRKEEPCVSAEQIVQSSRVSVLVLVLVSAGIILGGECHHEDGLPKVSLPKVGIFLTTANKYK